jgi:hypothetical protein
MAHAKEILGLAAMEQFSNIKVLEKKFQAAKQKLPTIVWR